MAKIIARSELKEFKDEIIRRVDRMGRSLRSLSERIFHRPELGYQEERASAWVGEFLREAGFRVEMGIAGMKTALRATAGANSGKGPTVAILAEYDALPGLGHACGHNIVGAAAAGAGAALAPLAKAFGGRVMVLGCPAEEGAVEGAGGKAVMVKHGVFRDVDVAMMIHPAAHTIVESGSMAREALEFRFTGKASHAAAAPHEGINALDALIQTFNSINALRQQLGDEVRVHGIITQGGEAPNIVPERAVGRFYVRARTKARLNQVVNQVKDCARGAALAIGAKVEVKRFAHTYENIKVNPTLVRVFERTLAELGERVTSGRKKGYGSTDMGNVSQVAPAIHPYIAISNRKVVGHTREFAEAAVSDRGYRGLLVGAKAMALAALELMASPSLLQQVKDDFQAY